MTTTPTPSTTSTAPLPTEDELIDVRVLVEEALRYYGLSRVGSGATAAGLTVHDLARNVRGWTHTTRLRDFVASTRETRSDA